MKPVTCDDCGGTAKDRTTSRKLPCAPCNGRGFKFVEGHDAWDRYRAHFGIEITPRRLAFEDALSECFDGAV